LGQSIGQGYVTVFVECFDNLPLRTLETASYVPHLQQLEKSPMTSQSIGNSPKLSALENQPDGLSAMEKITKLKTQCLSQLS